jgi:hypothetical protein
MTAPFLENTTALHTVIEVKIPEELEFFLLEDSARLGMAPDELVRQAVRSYCLKQPGFRNGGRD